MRLIVWNKNINENKKIEQMELLLNLGKQVLSINDLNKLLEVSVDLVIELAIAERGLIILFDSDNEIIFETARHLDKRDIDNPKFEISRTIINKVKENGKPLFFRNAKEEAILKDSYSAVKFKLLSVICVPLIYNNQTFGVIYLDNKKVENAFNNETNEFIIRFADFISLAAYNACKQKKLKNKVGRLELELRGKYQFESIIGHHPKIVELLKLVSQVSNIDATVLIQGESGTGKELVARALHFNSYRNEKPFVPINCGAIPKNLLESELFGHVRGAFTGANKDKIGWFERANGGTIFLDEVSEMSQALQVKLLRVLQSGEYSPVGSSENNFTDVRIIAATNKDLTYLISKEKFRDDLYYRLNIIDINLPPLRERQSDIPILIQHFLNIYSNQYKKENLHLTNKTESLLESYDYPGNVRELENIIQRAVALVEGKQIEPGHLPQNIYSTKKIISSESKISDFKFAKNNMLEKFELDYITECLKSSNGNISQAAKAAGIQYANFYAKVKKYNIEPTLFKNSK